MYDISEKALKTIEETVGTRFVRHVDGLSATTDIELVRLAGRSWMPQQPYKGPIRQRTDTRIYSLYSDFSKTSQDPLIPISLA